MGFDACLVPESALKSIDAPRGIRTAAAGTLAEALGMAMPSFARGRREFEEPEESTGGRYGRR